MICSGEVYDGEGNIIGRGLHLENGRIVCISQAKISAAQSDYSGRYIVPGFVDTHCHGGAGFSFSDNYEPDQIAAAIRVHHLNGTTALIASLVSLPDPMPQIQALLPFCESGELAGIHLEGPYVNPEKCGAQNPHALRNPDLTELRIWLQEAKGWIKTMTLAPELPGAVDAARLLIKYGARPSWGHTNDTGAATRAALTQISDLADSKILQTVTHLFNAMPPLTHRAPGPVREFIRASKLGYSWLEIIGDGVHVDLDLVGDVLEYVDNAYLVTDSAAVTGSEQGEHLLGGLPVELRDGGCYLTRTETLAGGASTIADQFRGLSEIDFSRLIRACVSVPANACGIQNDIGVTFDFSISSSPNSLILDDERNILHVFRDGQLVR
ncbi:amidohydrolase family protein [Propionimicrobium lymphophilum]|uniref:N-acetylglucosamine-6-phosphate deacetylase n=1 Tax=Propionimicrobium lymphophilum TaxID=33012 RepID=UPI0025505CE9|nr:amidohydrolase family protein [Propionimicrobium lymphophilum]MDK7710090.1 amidohydrolase family protein [Propionimicrobium lymphophilum]MDK7734105.1 amidohydrolase family protein [Propionimicrobium lymphophilum]